MAHADASAGLNPGPFTHTITVFNGGSVAVAFDMSHQAAVAQLWDADIHKSGTRAVYSADAAFSVSVIQVQPNTFQQFTVAFTPPDAPAFTVYNGYVILTPADTASSQASSPYPYPSQVAALVLAFALQRSVSMHA